MASAQSEKKKNTTPKKGTGAAAKGEKKDAVKKDQGAAKKSGASTKRSSSGVTVKKGGNTSAKGSAHAKSSGSAKPAAKRNSASSRAASGRKSSSSEKKRARGVEENPLAGRKSTLVYPVDAYDEYDLPSRKPAGRGRSGGRRKGAGFGLLNLFLLTAIMLMVFIGVWRGFEYQALAEMKAVVSRQTFYEGTVVEGVDVSNMTLSQAIDHWNRQIESKYRDVAVELDDGTRIAAEQLGYTSNYEQVLSGAWSAGRNGSLRQRYLQLTAGRSRSYEVSRANYDDALVRRFAAALADRVDVAPQNAGVEGFNTETYEFAFSAETEGRRLDQEALVRDIESALSAGGGRVTRQIEVLQPEITLENISSQYGMIASAVTNASSSSSNRLSNIRLAVSMIDGTHLVPGESFSFNAVVGERTRERGFKMATAYSSGTVTEEVGGGICQVSTTLFNAAMKAGLHLDERHAHSLTVSYVDLGKDAAVDWGNKDLKFTNNSDDEVYISCVVSEDKRVRFGVFGKLLPNGETLTLESVNTGSIDYDTQYQLSFELFGGQMRKLQEGKNGYTATTYLVHWDANGNEISRKELCKSRYQARPEIIEYGQ